MGIPEFLPLRKRLGGHGYSLWSESLMALLVVMVFQKLLGLKTSFEIHKERPLKISCHCDSGLTTSSSLHSLAQNWGALQSLHWGSKPRSPRLPTAAQARQETARLRRPAPHRFPRARPGTHWERIIWESRDKPLPPHAAPVLGPDPLASNSCFADWVQSANGPQLPSLLRVPPGGRRAWGGSRSAEDGYRPRVRRFPHNPLPAAPAAPAGPTAPAGPARRRTGHKGGKKAEDRACPVANYLVESAIGAPHFHHQLLHLLGPRAESPPPRGGLQALEAQPLSLPPPPRYRSPPGSGAAVTATARARRPLASQPALSGAAPHRKWNRNAA